MVRIIAGGWAPSESVGPRTMRWSCYRKFAEYIGLPPLLGHGDILGAENHSKDRAALQGLLPTQAFLGGKDVPRQERPSPVCDRPIRGFFSIASGTL